MSKMYTPIAPVTTARTIQIALMGPYVPNNWPISQGVNMPPSAPPTNNRLVMRPDTVRCFSVIEMPIGNIEATPRPKMPVPSQITVNVCGQTIINPTPIRH